MTFWVIEGSGETWEDAVPVEVDDGDEASAVEALVGEAFWEEVAISDACEGIYWVADNPQGIAPVAIKLRWELVREAEEVGGLTPPSPREEPA